MINTPFSIIPDEDLDDSHVYTTIQTYDRFARKFAEKWEWNPITVREIKKYNIEPFVRFAPKGGRVLIIGCQTGRDYKLLTEAGFFCLGVEYSYGLLTEALRRVPNGFFIHLYPKSLPFMPESFDGVYADMFCLIPKKDAKEVFKDFRIFLRRDGILYLSVKLGEGVMVIDDIGGKRYFTLFQKEEILELLKSVGLTVVWSQESSDTDPSLPQWFSLIARK